MQKDTEQFTSINFKPMTEGLGLNHFADGLPYTPNHAKKKPPLPFASGSRAQTQSTLRQAPVGTESARKMIAEFDAEAKSSTARAEPGTIETEPTTAGFVRRMFAYAFDVFFATAMFVGIVWSSFALNGYDLPRLLSEHRGAQMVAPLLLLYLVVFLGYFLIQETTWRRTLGKAIMGIRIRSTSGFATLGRAACFFIAAMPFGIGLFWYFFDSRHRCWHDVITDSEVVLS